MRPQQTYEKEKFVETADHSQSCLLAVPMPQRWYVIRTYPNQERRVMRTFEQRSISAYLPLITRSQCITRWRLGCPLEVRRNVTSPLFKDLIFIPDFQVNHGGILEVDGVDGYLRMGSCLPFLTPKLMADIRILEAIGNIPVSRRARLWKVGQSVRVTDGPFRSFNGVIDRLHPNARLKVLFEIFGRLTPAELSEAQIEAI